MLKTHKLQVQYFFLVIVAFLSLIFTRSASAGSFCNCPSGPHGSYGFEAFVIRVLEWNNGIPVSWADNSINPPQCTQPINSLGSTTYAACPKADMTVEHVDSCSTTNYRLNFLVDWAAWRPLIHDYTCDFDSVTLQLKNIPAGYRCVSADVGNIGNIPMTTDCFVTVPNGWGSHWVTFWIARNSSTVQGLKHKMPGRVTTSEPVRSQIITMDGTTSTGSQPFYFYDVPQGNHTFEASLPAVNYSVGYTACPDNTTCHNSIPITMSNIASLTTGAGGYTDLHWYYWEYGGWYRVRDGSLNYQGNLSNYIPPTVVPYDSFDTADTFLMNSATSRPNSSGVVLAAASIDVGPNAQLSNRGWGRDAYTVNKGYLSNISSFVEYARAKKDVVVISDINNVESDRINVIEGNVTISSNNFMAGKRNIVLIATGDVTIANIPGNIFNTPASRVSLAIISPQRIIFGPTITDASGIFIANEIDLAGGVTSSVTPLKIAGNVISNTQITQKRRRPDSEFQQASFYVIFQPNMYVDLLPYLSTIEVEGRQLDQ